MHFYRRWHFAELFVGKVIRIRANSSRQKAAARLKANVVNLKTATVVFGFLAALSAGTVSAADLHPIIEIETGYFFGASENGKWIKADQSRKIHWQEDNLPSLQPNETGRPNHSRQTKICRRTVS